MPRAIHALLTHTVGSHCRLVVALLVVFSPVAASAQTILSPDRETILRVGIDTLFPMVSRSFPGGITVLNVDAMMAGLTGPDQALLAASIDRIVRDKAPQLRKEKLSPHQLMCYPPAVKTTRRCTTDDYREDVSALIVMSRLIVVRDSAEITYAVHGRSSAGSQRHRPSVGGGSLVFRLVTGKWKLVRFNSYGHLTVR